MPNVPQPRCGEGGHEPKAPRQRTEDGPAQRVGGQRAPTVKTTLEGRQDGSNLRGGGYPWTWRSLAGEWPLMVLLGPGRRPRRRSR